MAEVCVSPERARRGNMPPFPPVSIFLRHGAIQRAQGNPDEEVLLARRHAEPLTRHFGDRRVIGRLDQLHILHPVASFAEHVSDAVAQQLQVWISDAINETRLPISQMKEPRRSGARFIPFSAYSDNPGVGRPTSTEHRL